MPEFKSFLRVLCARFLDRFPHICGNLLPSVYSRNELQHFYRIRTTSRSFHSATSAPLRVVNEDTNRLKVRVHFTQKFDNELEGKQHEKVFFFRCLTSGTETRKSLRAESFSFWPIFFARSCDNAF